MSNGLIIPAHSFSRPVERSFDSLEDYQAAVGGFIEPVAIRQPSMILWVNEEGKIRQMTPNLRATALWWLLEPWSRGHDVIAGDAVLTAYDDHDSDAQQFVAMLPKELPFRVQMRLAVRDPSWATTSTVFHSWFDAALFPFFAGSALETAHDVRVVPA